MAAGAQESDWGERRCPPYRRGVCDLSFPYVCRGARTAGGGGEERRKKTPSNSTLNYSGLAQERPRRHHVGHRERTDAGAATCPYRTRILSWATLIRRSNDTRIMACLTAWECHRCKVVLSVRFAQTRRASTAWGTADVAPRSIASMSKPT